MIFLNFQILVESHVLNIHVNGFVVEGCLRGLAITVLLLYINMK